MPLMAHFQSGNGYGCIKGPGYGYKSVSAGTTDVAKGIVRYDMIKIAG